MWGRLQALYLFRAQSSNPDNIINPSIVEAMPKYIPNSRFSDCWASVGDITFYHRNGQCYFRKKSVCKFQRTAGQIAVSEVHRRALAAWRALDHDVQLRWNECAKAVTSHRPPFDKTTHITGHNLFVSAYHGYAQLGNEHIPVPRRFEPFPIFSLDFVGCSMSSLFDMELRFRLTMYGTDGPSRYRVLGKIQIEAPGVGRNPGMMRNYLSESIPTGTVSDIVFNVPRKRFDVDMFQLHLRYLLIDSKTGYRSQYHSLSALATIL